MRIALLLPALVLAILSAYPARAQEFDPATNAKGWTRADADGSFTVFDAAGKRLITWMKDGTTLGHVDLSKLEGPPDSWVIDSYGNAWVVVGNSLHQVDKKGKVGNRIRLPGTVADMAWEPRGLILSYRAAEPYVEKREYKNGNLMWSWGSKPSGPSSPTALFRVAATNNNEVVVTRGASMAVDVLDLQTGKHLRQLNFVYKGAVAPELSLSNSDRGALVWWSGKTLALAAVPGNQAGFTKMNGLLMARIDFVTQSVEFLPTGLTEDHALVGVVENEAAFVSPKGGMVFVPVR